MKKFFSMCFLLLTTTIVNANCPLPPSGYYFGMAAWGNHTSDYNRVRCYYYHSNWTDQNEIDTDEYYNFNDLNGSGWYKGDPKDKYSLCRSESHNVKDCAFQH